MIFNINNLGIIKTALLNISRFTVISGNNGSGKSFLVRMIYAVLKSYRTFLNTNDMGDSLPFFEEILSKNIRWVFQQNYLGTLVNNHFNEALSVKVDDFLNFSMTKNDKKNIKINQLSLTEIPYQNISLVFLSSILDLEFAISNYREYYQNNFGVSDIYWDVLSSIRNIGISEQPELINIYQKIETIINGKVEYTSKIGSIFKSKGKAIDIKLSASGIKIFGFLQLLIERDILKKNSVLILEEPESHLHPSFCFQLIEILFELKNAGVTIILVTHSVEIIRYIEYLINTQQEKLTDFSLTLLEQIDHCTQLFQSKEGPILPKIMQTLTGDYFNLLLKEGNYFES